MAHSAVVSGNQLITTLSTIPVPTEEQDAVISIFNLLKQKKMDDVFQLITPTGSVMTIPNSMFIIWEQVAQAMADSVRQDLTIEEAADMLDIPSAYMTELLEDGCMPFIEIETERRILIKDILSYQRKRESDRKVALQELTRISQLFGGYEELR